MKSTATFFALSLLLLLAPDARAQFSRTDYPVGDGPFVPVFADFDGDGDVDLAATNINSGNVSVLENTTGGFSAFSGSPFAVGAAPVGLAAADFDGDGETDLATADNGSNTVTLLFGDGTGAFPDSMTVPTSEVGNDPYGLIAGDFDNDLDTDLAVTNRNDPGTVTILENDGTGSFTRAAQVGVGRFPRLIAAGDFDGDGLTDLASANNESGNVSILENTSGGGTLSFGNATSVPVGTGPKGIVAGEFTGDTRPDLAVANGISETVSVLENTSTAPGAFSFSVTTETVGANPFGITTGEFNGESGTDLAVANNSDGDVSFLINDGSGDFSRFVNDEPVGASPFGIAGADLNGDGITDLSVANFNDDDLSVLRSQSPLPVELAGDFSGFADESDVMLTWTTLSEQDNDYFRILQKKEGAFVEVGTEPSQVAGAPSSEAHDYRHRVENVAPGRHVFRLVQVDANSDEHVGPETTVEVGLRAAYRLTAAYPNPTRGAAQLTLQVQQPQRVHVEVYDLLGRPVQVLLDGPLGTGASKTLRLEGTSLASGTYLIRVTGETFSAVRKVTLVR